MGNDSQVTVGASVKRTLEELHYTPDSSTELKSFAHLETDVSEAETIDDSSK